MSLTRGGAGERGLTLIELLIAMVLLVAIVGGFYALVVTADRGWSLLQGQLETQQTSRLVIARIVQDLRQAADHSITSGQLTIKKTTTLTCPVSPGATQILVDDATDVAVNNTLTLRALLTVAPQETVTAIGAVTTCPANGASGTPLTITPALTRAFPYGTVVFPILVTYSFTPPTVPGGTVQLFRNGQVLADNVSAPTFTQPAAGLALAATAGSTSIVVTLGTSSFAPGDVIFIDTDSNTERRTVTGLSIGPLNVTLALDTGLFFTHPLGVQVRKKLSTIQITGQFTQPAAGGGQVQQITLQDEGGARN